LTKISFTDGMGKIVGGLIGKTTLTLHCIVESGIK
jgi:hypothetical protein